MSVMYKHESDKKTYTTGFRIHLGFSGVLDAFLSLNFGPLDDWSSQVPCVVKLYLLYYAPKAGQPTHKASVVVEERGNGA